MKHLSFLQKKVAVITLFMGLLLTASSFTFGPVDDARLVDNPPQKKVQRVKVMINKDGKQTTIDTTFNFPDDKVIQLKVDSMLKKMDIQGMGSGKSNVIIHRKRVPSDNKTADNQAKNEQFDILIQDGDSGKVKHMQRIIRMGKEGSVSYFGGHDGDQMMPPPPPPVPSHSKMMLFHQQLGGDPFAFDPKDESVVSYDKKDIGKGLEKITIIRKKKDEHQQNKEVQVTVETSDDSKK